MRTVAKMVVIAGALALAVTSAAANCIPAKLASTFNEQGYVYIDMGSGVTNTQTVGRFIGAGAPSNNNGTYGSSEWLFVDIGGKLSMQANLGDARVNGCPAGTLVTRIYTPTTNPPRFLTLVATEGSCGSSSVFDFRCCDCQPPFPTGGILSAVPVPRPRPLASSRIPGGSVNIHWSFDAVGAGNPTGHPAGALAAYELVRAIGSDPGRDPAGWTVVTSVSSDGTAPVTLDATANCGLPNQDEYYATRLAFKDNEKSLIVSQPTRVNCNPALAEPHFNVVPKRPTGPAKKPANP